MFREKELNSLLIHLESLNNNDKHMRVKKGRSWFTCLLMLGVFKKKLSLLVHIEFLKSGHRHMKVVDVKGEIY